MTKLTRSALSAEILANLPDNTTQAITPAIDRGVRQDAADSNIFLTDLPAVAGVLKTDGTQTFAGISNAVAGTDFVNPAILNRNIGPRIRIASQHGGFLNCNIPQSNGTTQVSGTDRFQFQVNTTVESLQFLFVNGYATNFSNITNNGNSILMHAGFENTGNYSVLQDIDIGSNTGQPISSGGRTGSYLADGAMVLSRPVPTSILIPSTNYYYRIYKIVTSGQKWPNIGFGAPTSTGGFLNFGGTSTTDQVYGASVRNGSDQTKSYGSTAWESYGSNPYAFSAVAIIGEQVVPRVVVLITGDSIAAGANDALGRGYLGLACTNAGIAFHNDGCSGTALTYMNSSGQVYQYLASYVDHVVIHCLTNDLGSALISTLAQAQALYLTAVNSFGRSYNTVWLCTMIPRTPTSSDFWATYSGQTIPSYNALRVTVNNWLRDKTSSGCAAYMATNLPSNIKFGGIIDTCPAIERNSDGSALVLDSNGQQTTGTGGYWLVDGNANTYTKDGIHANPAATALMAPLVGAASKFV